MIKSQEVLLLEEDIQHYLKINLQLFAEGQGGERTEKATPKKKEKAREEGQVIKSQEVTTAAILVFMFLAIKMLGPFIIENFIIIYKTCLEYFTIRELTVAIVTQISYVMAIRTVMILVPILLISFGIAFISNVAQVGWKPSAKPLMPKLSNLSPLSGFKRIFSLKTLVELVKSILKLVLIGVVVYNDVKDYPTIVMMFYDVSVVEAYGTMANIILNLGIKIGLFFIVVALIDYIYERYSYEKKLKMSKQEIKDENKQSEGNPEIKGRIRQKMREASMRRMMQDLPKADVIITNPTHFAVAIQYDDQKSAAPIVIAKGADLVAARIKDKAKEYGVEIVENKPLARTLFYTVEIGDEIPPEMYQTVAEVLAFIYHLKNERREGVKA